MLLFAIALLAASPSIELTTPEVARDRLLQCGLGPVTIRKDESATARSWKRNLPKPRRTNN